MDHIREQTYRESEQDVQQSVSIHAHAHVHGNGRRQRRRTGSLPHYMKPRAVSLIADGIINPTLKPQPPSPGSMTPGTGVRPAMGKIKQGEAMARLAAPPKRPDPPESTPFKGRKKSFIAPSSAHTTTTTTTTVNADAIVIVTASTAAMNSTDRSATSTATDVADDNNGDDDKDLFDTISEPEPSVSSSLPVDNFNENLDYVQVVSPTELSRDRGSSPTKIKDIHIIPKGDEIKFTPVQPKEPLRSIRPRVQSQALSVRRTSILRKAGTDVVKSESPTKLNNQSGPRRRISRQGVAVPVVTPPVYKVKGKDKLENGCEKTCGVVDNIQVDFNLSKDEPVQLSTSNNAEHFNLSNHGNNGSEKSSSQQLESCVHLEKSETNDLIMDEEAQYLHDNFDGDVDINVDVDVVADDAMCIQFIEGDPPPYSEIEENENEIEIEIDENDFTILDTTDDRNSHQKSNSDMSIEIDEMGYGESKGEEVREEAVIEEEAEEEERAEEVRRESNINPKSTKPQIKINIKNRKSSTFGKVDVNRKTSVEGSEKSSFHAIMPISV